MVKSLLRILETNLMTVIYSLFLLQDILNINSNGGPKEVFTTA